MDRSCIQVPKHRLFGLLVDELMRMQEEARLRALQSIHRADTRVHRNKSNENYLLGNHHMIHIQLMLYNSIAMRNYYHIIKIPTL